MSAGVDRGDSACGMGIDSTSHLPRGYLPRGYLPRGYLSHAAARKARACDRSRKSAAYKVLSDARPAKRPAGKEVIGLKPSCLEMSVRESPTEIGVCD